MRLKLVENTPLDTHTHTHTYIYILKDLHAYIFKMAVIPLFPKTKMVDVGKVISLENLLVRKVTWFVLTMTSASLILSGAFGAGYMTRIANIYSCLPRTLSLSLTHILTYRESTLSLHFRLPETAWPCQLIRHNSIRIKWVCINSATFFFPVLPFRLDLFQLRTQPQKFRQTPKETNNQHGRRQVPPRIHCYIPVYWYLAWNT